ncbi:MAG: sn-glycerol-1-phosphate dehydrogenase [Clostridiales bacterium]|nr:sn-glycerol-1-phosphate dehydrogenase [Clostridiales bacterium]
MDIEKLLSGLVNCKCGREHDFDTRLVEIGSEILDRTGELLDSVRFPKRVLLVADRNTLKASEGLLECLERTGYIIKLKLYEDLTLAEMHEVVELQKLSGDVDGILAVGSGSICDICRVAAYRENKEFAVFATAPSMDGFASDTAPIIENGFKLTRQAKQPIAIIGDTKILAAAPAELKAAGFGDMIGKFTALTDWKISNILTGEYFCDKIAELTLEGLKKVTEQADRIASNDEKAAASVMEGLVLSGLAMKLAGSSRPASGAEHVLSHFWECKKLAAGLWPEFHGKKVGVASVIITKLYRKLAMEYEYIEPTPDTTDWEAVKAAYGPELEPEMMKMNNPTITSQIEPTKIKEIWPQIRQIVLKTLPEDDELLSLMIRAGAAIAPAEVNVGASLLEQGLKYHPYMRHRVLLTRLIPMLGLEGKFDAHTVI